MDSGATAGYYLDHSAGAAQFEGNVYIGGTMDLGDITSEGIRMDGSTGRFEWRKPGAVDPPDY
ncbi:MAG: hypothetical protein GWN18_00100, partial [Thermoplasmata archaeon]|nr:hypothetical protein [Thermoplasmata archaeon]NIS18358.1 hypothetical protein [Thermoplasmata archaeon]NIV77169.1 hypothetical protein [Thermoplasmata archaeon]NIW80993.1 hypothetical protein [Thermoplasmata archaeon]NIW87202.1 hypothetical protein [Thermoplasmata archaeon]